MMNSEQTEELLRMMQDDQYYATCKACGYEQEVEPDAEYPCPECKKGRLASPLVEWGMI
jgi:predicted Zn-ribbon and HTH transcriptional regulator